MRITCAYCEKPVEFQRTEKSGDYVPNMKGRICPECVKELSTREKK